jgi:hypothetical protein
MRMCGLSDHDVQACIASWHLSKQTLPESPLTAPSPPLSDSSELLSSNPTTFRLPDIPSHPWWLPSAAGYFAAADPRDIVKEYHDLASGGGEETTITRCGSGSWTAFNLMVHGPPRLETSNRFFPLILPLTSCNRKGASSCRLTVLDAQRQCPSSAHFHYATAHLDALSSRAFQTTAASPHIAGPPTSNFDCSCRFNCQSPVSSL